jgi:hypothetical protein
MVLKVKRNEEVLSQISELNMNFAGGGDAGADSADEAGAFCGQFHVGEVNFKKNSLCFPNF